MGTARSTWPEVLAAAGACWEEAGGASSDGFLGWCQPALQISKGNSTDLTYWWPVCLFQICLASKVGEKLCLEA